MLGSILIVCFMVCFFVVKHETYQMRSFVMLLATVLLFLCVKLTRLSGGVGEMGIPVLPGGDLFIRMV